MNPEYTICLLLVIMSCTSQEKVDQTRNSQSIIDFAPLERSFGAYISVDYLEELKKHGSTKMAQEKATMSTATIDRIAHKSFFKNTWGFHEGSDSEQIHYISEVEGIVVTNTGDTLYYLDFSRPDELVVTGDKERYHLIKYSSKAKNADFHEIINEVLLKGKFISQKDIIEFTSKGKVIGLDSVIAYSFNIDYYDAGMEYDMIYLTFEESEFEKYFGYSIKDDSLLIYRLNCDQMIEDNPSYCVKYSKGETIYRMKKIKD